MEKMGINRKRVKNHRLRSSNFLISNFKNHRYFLLIFRLYAKFYDLILNPNYSPLEINIIYIKELMKEFLLSLCSEKLLDADISNEIFKIQYMFRSEIRILDVLSAHLGKNNSTLLHICSSTGNIN